MSKEARMLRADDDRTTSRPVMLAIAGDSAAGKTTLTKGIVEALGHDRATAICVDDYHRYDRQERKDMPFTALHPDCNYLGIMEQHLQLLATGQPVLKPVYDHSSGELVRPELIEPHEFVIVEGLLPLHSKLARACFDITVYLDPPEEIRLGWKLGRDTSKRGYAREQVEEELARREPESKAYIQPQRAWADVIVRFAPIARRNDPPETPLSAELLLRPTIRHPDVSHVVGDDDHRTMHLKLIRDQDGRPVEALHVHGYAPREDTSLLMDAIWSNLDNHQHPMPDTLGKLEDDSPRNDPLAITQMLLLYHLLDSLS